LVCIYLQRRLGKGSKEPESDSFLQLVEENLMSNKELQGYFIVLYLVTKEGMLSNNKLKR
jgi:hypothetical protein